MKQTTLIIIAALTLTVFTGIYVLYDQTFNRFWTTERIITEQLTNKTKFIRLDIDPEAQYPHTIDLNLKGYLDGKAIVSYGWADTAMYMVDTVENNFDLNYRIDWYSDWCLIKYEPLDANDGNITIDCKIYSGRK